MPSHKFSLLALCLALSAGCTDGSSSNSESTRAEVTALIASGDLVSAETQAKELVLRDPGDPSLRLMLGRIYLSAEDGPAASAAFERARALGASGPNVLQGLAESLLLQRRYGEVLELLGEAGERPSLSPPLLRLRLQARLRVPLARPRDLFLDARQLLTGQSDNTASVLEDLVSQDGVISANADHVRRTLAYWSCQQPAAPAEGASDHLYLPAWANLDETGRRILSVGPDHELKTPGAAARIAEDGDIVEIDAGTYHGDVAVWRASDLWIRAKGGKVVLDSGGATAGDMGIWVIRGDNTIVDGIRFEGARATHKNGSGIRLLAHNLWVRRSEFHDNEDGILSFNQPGGEVIVEHSIFTENGAGDGYSHNIYIGRTDRLIFRFNYSAGVRIGHLLKSRAMENYILYNRLSDDGGNSSYTIDLPEGGFALVLGNEIEQGPLTVNNHMVSLGAEEHEGRDHRFIFAYNTFYNHSSPATFIRDATHAGVTLINNVFAGAPANLDIESRIRVGNAFDATGDLLDPELSDYGLRPSASFIDRGETIEEISGISVVPEFEYVHPAGAAPREAIWQPDPGAHEFCGWPDYRS